MRFLWYLRSVVGAPILLYINRVWNQCDQKLFEPTKLKCHWISQQQRFRPRKMKFARSKNRRTPSFWNLKHLILTFTHENKISRTESKNFKRPWVTEQRSSVHSQCYGISNFRNNIQDFYWQFSKANWG